MYLSILINILEEGFIYGIMAMGVYISYKVLDFPDLSVDGTLPLGACVTALMIVNGMSPVAALLVSFAAGCLAGAVTGLLHVKLKITDLLSGILTMTALLTVNLLVTGKQSVLYINKLPTIFTDGPVTWLPEAFAPYRRVIVLAVVVAAVKLIMDWFFKTRIGLMLRAAGSNLQYVTAQAVNPGLVKILGLTLANGLTALSGSVLAQQARSASVTSGAGMVVMGLASVIIGTTLLGKVRGVMPTTQVIAGAVVYKACLAVATLLRIDTVYLKLLMSALFVVALVAGRALDRKGGKRHAHG
ncbi:ABC transporter permease [Bacillota bacterium Meth-B3]|nr:ABC transporter permease [Christensenellaceae bacterium]MEA5068133.1 ABC transporter permease [Christensenellaceae bacterium]